MTIEVAFSQVPSFLQHRACQPVLQEASDYTIRYLATPTPRAELCYPSPSMSRPPSLTRPSVDLLAYTPNRAPSDSDASIRPTPTPTLEAPDSALSFRPLQLSPLLDRSPSNPLPSGSSIEPSDHAPRPSTTQHAKPSKPIAHSSVPSSTAAEDFSGARSARKSKTHVASACSNCKKAHLSCDIQRPCTRCVAAGKQDTCVDVQHKKRGRPRLREESHFQGEQVTTDLSLSAPIASPEQPDAPRPIATPRDQRADSFRSLRSQVKEEPAQTLTSAESGPSTAASQGYESMTGVQSSETPTALLDLNFVFLRANRSFQLLMSDGRDIRGRQLAEIAVPVEGDDFGSILGQLRSEREAVEPALVSPITTPSGPEIVERDLDRWSRGFSDRTYRWRKYILGPSEEIFDVRVRLARTNTYFVALTILGSHRRRSPALPTSSPLAIDRSTLAGASPEFQRPISRTGSVRQQISSASAMRPLLPEIRPLMSHGPLATPNDPRYFSPPQSSHQNRPDRGLQSSSFAMERPSDTGPSTSRSTHLELRPSSEMQRSILLPPIQTHPPEEAPVLPPLQRPPSSSQGEREEERRRSPSSPKRRRRMDINNFLQ